MIRFSTNNDIEGIISLWHEAFGDSENEISFFLKSKFKPENTVVYDDNGKIASMLFLLEGKMCIKRNDYPAYYLYAACTAKSQRSKGIMAMLLDFAEKTAQSRGVKFICLMPGEKSLFDFYSKHEYKTVFHRKKLIVSRDNIKENTFEIIQPCRDEGISKEALRNKAFEKFNFFKWDNEAIDFSFEHTKLYSGDWFLDCKGYVLYSEIDNSLFVKEYTFSSEILTSISALLFSEHEVENIIFNLPANYPTAIGSFVTEPSAMMLPTDNDAELLMNGLKNAYLGLTLD